MIVLQPVSAQQESISLSITVIPGLEPLIEPIVQRYEAFHTNIHVDLKGMAEVPVQPGHGVGVTAMGFAVSTGTAYPDQAYQLVKFLIADQGIT